MGLNKKPQQVFFVDWATLSRGIFDIVPTPCPLSKSQRLEKECILDMAQQNAHFQQHACSYFVFECLLWCSNDRTMPLVKKICNSMAFQAANRLRVDKVQTIGCFFLCCLCFVLWREWRGSHNITAQKKRLNWWIHTKKHRNTSKVRLLYLFYRRKVKIKWYLAFADLSFSRSLVEWHQLYCYSNGTDPDVQQIFSTLVDTGEANDYAAGVTALNGYFLSQSQLSFCLP